MMLNIMLRFVPHNQCTVLGSDHLKKGSSVCEQECICSRTICLGVFPVLDINKIPFKTMYMEWLTGIQTSSCRTYCAVLYCAVLQYTLQYSYCAVLYTLHCNVMHYTTLYFIICYWQFFTTIFNTHLGLNILLFPIGQQLQNYIKSSWKVHCGTI